MASSSRGGGTPGRVNCLTTADRVTLSSGTAFSPLNTSQFPHAKNTSQYRSSWTGLRRPLRYDALPVLNFRGVCGGLSLYCLFSMILVLSWQGGLKTALNLHWECWKKSVAFIFYWKKCGNVATTSPLIIFHEWLKEKSLSGRCLLDKALTF